MAPKKSAPSYDPEVDYEVTLARPVMVFGVQQLLPLHRHTIHGDVLIKIIEENGADVVADATPVA